MIFIKGLLGLLGHDTGDNAKVEPVHILPTILHIAHGDEVLHVEEALDVIVYIQKEESGTKIGTKYGEIFTKIPYAIVTKEFSTLKKLNPIKYNVNVKMIDF